MEKDTGLIIRSIPYSDSARILHCFTENHGLTALFTRLSSKRRVTGHLMPGGFIEFTARTIPGKTMKTIGESRWDPNIPTDALSPERVIVWTFTLELLQKSLKENFALPNLLHRIRLYYALLTQREVGSNPLIPLAAISAQLGLSDAGMVTQLCSNEVRSALQRLGFPVDDSGEVSITMNEKELFNVERDRFQEHFGITQLETLYLIEL